MQLTICFMIAYSLILLVVVISPDRLVVCHGLMYPSLVSRPCWGISTYFVNILSATTGRTLDLPAEDHSEPLNTKIVTS